MSKVTLVNNRFRNKAVGVCYFPFLLGLPYEIYDLLFDGLKASHFCSLRLTCKRLAEICCRYLVPRVRLIRSSKALQRLSQIARHPLMVQHVREIVLYYDDVPFLSSEENQSYVQEQLKFDEQIPLVLEQLPQIFPSVNRFEVILLKGQRKLIRNPPSEFWIRHEYTFGIYARYIDVVLPRSSVKIDKYRICQGLPVKVLTFLDVNYLPKLNCFAQVRRLYIHNKHVRDRDYIKDFNTANFPFLEDLSILCNWVQQGCRDIESLGDLTQLKQLQLSHFVISESSMPKLPAKTNLRDCLYSCDTPESWISILESKQGLSLFGMITVLNSNRQNYWVHSGMRISRPGGRSRRTSPENRLTDESDTTLGHWLNAVCSVHFTCPDLRREMLERCFPIPCPRDTQRPPDDLPIAVSEEHFDAFLQTRGRIRAHRTQPWKRRGRKGGKRGRKSSEDPAD